MNNKNIYFKHINNNFFKIYLVYWIYPEYKKARFFFFFFISYFPE